MDRREQITQMLKDRIAKFKRENAHIWAKTEPDRSQTLTHDERETSKEHKDESEARAIKRALGF
tara:strand:- start:507 stop:698 length:192 start_codon:yes stop_codon:yes gene_type:complete